MIETDEWGDIYLGPEDLCTANADTVYITIVGENFTNVTNISVSATNGDVSTGICNYIIHVCKWELSRLCHVTKNNHLIIFTTVYYGLLGGYLRMGALLVCFMNCPPNSN